MQELHSKVWVGLISDVGVISVEYGNCEITAQNNRRFNISYRWFSSADGQRFYQGPLCSCRHSLESGKTISCEWYSSLEGPGRLVHTVGTALLGCRAHFSWP